MVDHYFSFLLRMFRPGASQASLWKFTLQNTSTLETLNFATLLELHQFLGRLIDEKACSSAGSPEGESYPGIDDVGIDDGGIIDA